MFGSKGYVHVVNNMKMTDMHRRYPQEVEFDDDFGTDEVKKKGGCEESEISIQCGENWHPECAILKKSGGNIKWHCD